MASQALDLTTMGHALAVLGEELGAKKWYAVNPEQERFFAWLERHRDELMDLTGLMARASTDCEVLNAFLAEHGFDLRLEPLDGIGVVSILDMLIEWLSEGTVTTIGCYDRAGANWADYPAFRLQADGVDVYDVTGYPDPLVRLRTKTGHGLWLMKASEPTSGLELAMATQRLLTAERRSSLRWTVGVTVPMLEMDICPDVSWMLGACVREPEYWFLAQALQQFKLRANERGARVKVATAVFVLRGIPRDPQPYVFNQPFIGFVTQPEHDNLALAAFWADTDAWRTPEGELEDL